jgi:UDP-N-acetylglucosamine diphosphorylase/glucosamine-1-phosphate N-acetyltransferase
MNLILFDIPEIALQLRPFTFTRPISEIRVGIFTQKERWEKLLSAEAQIFTSEDLQPVWPRPTSYQGLWVNSAWIPNQEDLNLLQSLSPGKGLKFNGLLLAFHSEEGKEFGAESFQAHRFQKLHSLSEAKVLSRPWEIFSWNGKVLREDFQLITQGRTSLAVSDPHTVVYGKENLFLEEGVDIKAAIINAEDGPVYLGKNVQIQEGSILKGPFAILEGSVVNMGAKIRPDTTVGPFCKVGGEINNAVFFGYSNKAHDGFLGNSVIGEWCNLGADSNNSNLKNNYGEVKIYSYAEQKMIGTGLQFCGLIMGDHSKSSINSMFNTGTVIGVGCNIFDGGFPPKHIQSFSWGGKAEGFEMYQFEKFIEAESRVLARRKKTFTPGQVQVLRNLYEYKKNLYELRGNPLLLG